MIVISLWVGCKGIDDSRWWMVEEEIKEGKISAYGCLNGEISY